MDLLLNLSFIKFFLDAASTGSISESANRNYVSQSAVSQAIRKLELILGVPLYHHKKQIFKLTNEGNIILQHAPEIFSAIKNMYNALDHHKQHLSMPIYFVSTHSIGLSLLPMVIPTFKAIDVSFQLGGLTQIRSWLKHGIADFAIVLDDGIFHGFSKYEIMQGSFKILTTESEKSDPYNKGIYIEAFRGMGVSEFIENFEKKYKKPFPYNEKLNNWTLIAQCLLMNGGYGLLPDFLLFNPLFTNLKASVNIDLSIDYKICAIYPKGHTLTASSLAFLKLLKSQIQKAKP